MQPYTRGLGSFSLYLLLAAYLTRARAGLVASLPADPMLSDYLLVGRWEPTGRPISTPWQISRLADGLVQQP